MKFVATIIVAVAVGYVLLVLVLYLSQERMLFLRNMPGRSLVATPADVGWDYDDVYLKTSDGARLHGWYVHAPDPGGTLLFFHGNAGNISHRLDSIAIFREMGLDTLIIDYRGYGQSDGRPSEQGTYKDAETAWQYLVGERKLDPARIVVFGRSLGGAVAAWLASTRKPRALIVESGFTSAADMGARLYPFLPVRLIARLQYPVAAYVANATCPVLVIHSRDDEIIPFDMGEALYEAAAEPKSFLRIAGDHNNGFLDSRERYVKGIQKFVAPLLPMPAGDPPG